MLAGFRRSAPASQSLCLNLCPCPSSLLSPAPRRGWRRSPRRAPSDGGGDPAQASDPQADPAAAGRGVPGGGEHGRDRAQGGGRHQRLGGQEFILSEDYNKMTPVKNYQAHQSRVTMILFVLELEWVLSTGQDKQFAWHCSESGQRLGGYRTSAVASGLQFDVETRHVFIGDHSGQVTILKLEQENCTLVTTFRGHTGGVTALCWDPVQRVLFSGSSDHSVIMWDIGGRKGTAIELQGHNDKVQALSYAQHTRQLISCGGDGGIVVWNMDVERQETPEWLDSDSCQKCDQPFFWNFKQMWDSKKIGLRQHHCRKCGKAVCGKCSSKRSSIPLMGFEFEVRVCDSCHEAITDEERAPTATFHDSKHNIVHVHFDETRGWLLTSGTDKVIKLWDMTPVVS
ncbi:WD repeat and FYVE domain-containing protein 2 isoform X2 [Cebus imitator]|uniref:WD repeat and FYVE domain-containing protein 2 isoform X2 n=1 Tax=Sapajus apella TaxID=9515 RepID=A0A6J3J7P8_SAPAP|nr:WD repeat and FYVE domain-containing protein 2 isoform X2 [Sapajus apella]XP_037599366.1 WD repeat and FYVE domain-containing protein 2 isoform X2 [Cebus imitator]